MRNWAPSLFASLLLAAAVAATPHQIIWIEDTLFVQGNGTLMIPREIKADQGMRHVTQADTFFLTPLR